MKRKEIIKTIDKAGEYLDSIGCAVIKNVDTGEFMEDGALTKEEIRAMQTTLCICTKFIEDDERIDPINFAIKLVTVHTAVKNDLFADEGDAE